jgi:hypothetical protein
MVSEEEKVKIFEKYSLTEDERNEINWYIKLYVKLEFTHHWQVNQWIQERNAWDKFKNIRAINDHVNASGVPGIKPKFFAIVCQISGEDEHPGSHLIKSTPY